MAPTCMGLFRKSILLIVLSLYIKYTEAVCTFPSYVKGSYFSMVDGTSVNSLIDNDKWDEMNCMDVFNHSKPNLGTLGQNHTFLLKNPNSQCFHCVDVLWRTENVIQYLKGECQRNDGTRLTDCSAVKEKKLPLENLVTMFRTGTDTVNINCISTFEGVYQYTYEVNEGGGGICDSPESQIQACQDPGSSYIDNQVFRMVYGRCRDVATSFNKVKRYQCLGTWIIVKQNQVYTYAAIADTVENDQREKFKCMVTNRNQKEAFNKVRWTMSRFARCTEVQNAFVGPLKLVLTRIVPSTTYLTPQCSLPRNLTGTWRTQGVQYMSSISINDTHIYFRTEKDEYEYQETYYSCQQSQGTRYLMTKVVVGKCEVDFTCFDIVARHHSIVRFRVGKPYQYQISTEEDPRVFLKRTFREACSWTAFTFNRDDYEWNYETMILDPPSPVPCPIAGRYSFVQSALTRLEEYRTRIRGVTEKPRVQVPCRNWVTEFKSCSNTMTRIQIDAEYCESVDYRGRPIGEYDEPDNILTCVGFWMEDMKSYLVTWDEEDAISSYRCWVYERKSWTGVYMSRAQNARCPRTQDAQSYQLPGTGLALDLTESERLFDDCPQRFDNGANPYSKPITLWVLNGARTLLPSSLLSVIAIVTAIFTIVRH